MKKVLSKILSFFVLFILINIISFFIANNNADLSEEGWTDDIRITENEFHSNAPQIAVFQKNIHLVWHDDRNGKYGIYYKKSTDNGSTWSNVTVLSIEINYNNMGPSIDLYENNIHVVWTCNKEYAEISYRRSLDNGNTWSLEEIISSDDNNESLNPRIAVNNNNILVSWSDYKDDNLCPEVYFKKSMDNGITWSLEQKLSNIDGKISLVDDIVVNGNNVYLVWFDEINQISYEVYFRKSNDLGESWSSAKRLTTEDGIDSLFSVIGVDGNNIHVIWENIWDQNWEIGYTRSIDGGENWNKYVGLSEDDSFSSSYGDIVVNGNNIHVIWTDKRDGNFEVYYKKSFDNGGNWEQEKMISNNDGHDSGNGRMAIVENYIHIAFVDTRDGNEEIYYKQKGNAPPKLSLDYVNPSYGNIFTDFYYNLTYSDLEDDPPVYIYVNINGINYSMNETDKNDWFVKDGKKYYYSTKLNKSEDHHFSFYASDGHKNVETETFSGPLVGTGPPKYIIINPKLSKITTDDLIKFTADVYDNQNNILNITPKWETSGGGTIDHTGNFTATIPGNWTIYANISEISGNAYVNVTLGKLKSINIFPNASEITTDDYIHFKGFGYDADGNEIWINPTWDVSGGGLIDQDGNFTATTPGTYFVIVNESGISSTAVININHGELKNIKITPFQASITTDDYIQFSAIGYDLDKNIIEISPSWGTTGGGVIDYSGNFSASKSGIWKIFANISEISANVSINISIGKLANIEIIPSSPTVLIGDYIIFSPKGFDAEGNLININPQWEVNGGGYIDQTGNFSAQEIGNWTLFVNVGEISNNTNIYVNPKNIIDEDDNLNLNFSTISISLLIILIFLLIYIFLKVRLSKKSS